MFCVTICANAQYQPIRTPRYTQYTHARCRYVLTPTSHFRPVLQTWSCVVGRSLSTFVGKLNTMLNAGESGFVNAPVTKVVVVLVVVLTLFGSILGSHTRLVLSLPALLDGQVWRLLTQHFVFSTPGELLFGIVLLYYFRQFERQMGSARYAALFVFCTILQTAALVAAHALLPPQLPRPAPGPYALVFAGLIRFAFETPPLYNFQILGSLTFSDKAFPYLLALQLALSAPVRSFVPVASAVLAGLLARIPPLASMLTTPKPIVDICSATLLPLLGTIPPRTRALRRRRAAAGGGPARNAPVNTAEAQRAVSGVNIDTLISMGFSRQAAIDALLRCNDDVQMATEQLLAQGPTSN